MTNSNKLKVQNFILNEIKNVAVCCVSTISGNRIRSRMMHFAVSDEFKIYLSSLKTDPKTKQIVLNPNISLLVYIPGATFPEDKEIEIIGYTRILKEKQEIEYATNLLFIHSPVVAQLKQYNKLDMLSFIEVIPIQVKFRQVKDILQGIPPTVIEFGQYIVSENDFEKFKRKFNVWVTETRYPFLSVSILPVLLGTVIAWMKKNVFNFLYFILTLLGVSFLHLGTNIINDYFDHKSGNDELNTEFIRPFSGGSRMIQLGLLTPLEVLVGAMIFFILGISIGLYLTYKCGAMVLLLGLVGVISGFFYTAAIFNWASKGIGEVLVGLNFGVFVSLGSYYVQTKTFSLDVLLASLPLSMLVTAILLINEIPDYNADKKVGKNNLVVRLGKQKATSILGYILLSSYLTVIATVIAGYVPKFSLLCLISLPLAVQAMLLAKKFYDSPFEMAVGNGFVILCFNIVGLILILSYLYFSVKSFHLLLILFLSIGYILWNYRVITQQKATFLEVKRIIE